MLSLPHREFESRPEAGTRESPPDSAGGPAVTVRTENAGPTLRSPHLPTTRFIPAPIPVMTQPGDRQPRDRPGSLLTNLLAPQSRPICETLSVRDMLDRLAELDLIRVK